MRQQDLVFCVAIQTCRASRRRTERYPATRCLHRPAASVFRSSAAAYAPVRMQLTKSSLRKAFSLSFPQLLAQTIAIKASTPKVGSGSLSTSSCFGRKSPDTPWVFSWYAETRRHRCKHTCGLHACPFLFAAWRWSLLPFALFMCAVGLVAGLLLGRLACKGDEDMSPWPRNGAGLRVLLASRGGDSGFVLVISPSLGCGSHRKGIRHLLRRGRKICDCLLSKERR